MRQSASHRVLVVSSACAAWLAAAPVARGESCDSVLQRAESSSPHGLDCGKLRALDQALRTCVDPGGQLGHRLAMAHWEVDVARRQCPCASALSAGQLGHRLDAVASAFELAVTESDLAQAERCVGDDAAERKRLEAVRAGVTDLVARSQKADGRDGYCRAAGFTVPLAGSTMAPHSESPHAARSEASAAACYRASLDRAALERWLACPAGSAIDRDAARKALDGRRGVACGRVLPTPSCDTRLANASELRRTTEEPAQRRLWNLVATQLLAAAGARATADDRACATRMITSAISDGTSLEDVVRDPVLRRLLANALKNVAHTETLARLLAGGNSVQQILDQAVLLSEEDRRRVFNIAGVIGRGNEAARLLSAYELGARAFDVVIAPEPDSCKYADFVQVLAAGFASTEPANVVHVPLQRLTATVDSLLAARLRSCGRAAPAAASGPGCGAVIAVQLDDHDGMQATGEINLHFVVPDTAGSGARHEPRAIAIPRFQLGCGPDSEGAEIARDLSYDLQFQFARAAAEPGVIVPRPVPAQSCRVRPLPPSKERAQHDGNGVRIASPRPDTPQANAATGARDTLASWQDAGVGKVDASAATATLQFSAVDEPRSVKIQADLALRDRVVASFASVVLRSAPGCDMSLAQGEIEAGRQIGYDVGSFLASRYTTPLDPPPPRSWRRWGAPIAVGAGIAFTIGGFYYINRSVDQQNTAMMHGLPPSASNDNLRWGQGLLIAAAVSTIAGGILAFTR